MPPRAASLKIMTGFDALPPPVRQAIASAGYPLSPAIVPRLMRQAGTIERAIRILRAVDARLCRKGVM